MLDLQKGLRRSWGFIGHFGGCFVNSEGKGLEDNYTKKKKEVENVRQQNN